MSGRPSAWTPNIPPWFPVNWHFTAWRRVFWAGVWVFVATSVAAGIMLAEALA